MNGSADLQETASLSYLFLGSRDLHVRFHGKEFVSLLSGHTVNIALKSETPLAESPVVYATFFRNRSMETPAEITFGRKIREVEACGQNGESLAKVPFAGSSFRTLWENGNRISHYKITFQDAE